MRILKLLFPILLFCNQVSAQTVVCDTMSLVYVNSGITFSHALSATDSMITLPMVNNTHTNFAYPQVKLVNTTPLPTGMSLYSTSMGWVVFASAWNVGDTAYAHIEYNVNNPIPDNYMVTYTVYAHNFSPLSIDSCVFSNTITVNLKPVGTSAVSEVNGGDIFSFYPNPANNSIHVTAAADAIVDIYSPAGTIVQTDITDATTRIIDISGLAAGVYFMRERATEKVLKLVKY